MPDSRGDVLCPTCDRWTPPAPFCTECGAALPVGPAGAAGAADAGALRRGSEVEDPGAPWSGAERFEPEPADEAAIAAAAGSAGGAARIDHLAETEPPPGTDPPWPAEPGLTAASTAAAVAGEVPAPATKPAPKPRRAKATATPPPEEPLPVTPPPQAPPPAVPPPASAGSGDDGNGGVSGLVFVLFLGLGILALLGGAILGGVFDSDPTAEATPSPTAAVSTPTPEPETAAPGTPDPSASATAIPTPAPSLTEPTTFPDGFIARAEACEEQPTDSTCDNSGAVNQGDLWVLVSFRSAAPTDVIGVAILDSSGSLQGEASLLLDFCGTNTACAGYTYFRFTNLDPGEYDVKVNRNGTPAAVTAFTVE